MSILIGLFGSFLMFLGDMTLYYDSKDYDGKDTINSIIGIMKNVSIKRLYIGGLLVQYVPLYIVLDFIILF